MKSRLTYLAVAIMVIASMLLTACGPEASPTTAPVVPTATTGAAAPTATTAQAAAPTATTAQAAAPTATTAGTGMDATATTGGAAPTATTAAAAPTATTAQAAGGDASPTAAPLATAPPGAKVLRFNMGNEPATTDPQKMSFVTEIGWGELVFEALLELDEEGNPVPAAAESVTVSDDGTVYTVKLKEGLTYSDGTPLTAQNFEYAFRRLFDPRVTGRDYASIAYIIKGSQELSELEDTTNEAQITQLNEALGVKATADDTIEFTLEQEAAYFPFILTLWVGWPSRQDMVEKGGDTWTEPATYIGNGPFKLTSWSHGSGAVFEANENFRKGRPKIDRIDYRMINDSAVAFQAYRQGELDVVGVAAEDLQSVQNDATLKAELVDIPGNCTFYIGFNNELAPFDNIKVRQAFAQAFDREDYVEVVLRGLGQPAYSFIPPDRPGHAADLAQPEFDATEAKRLLDEVVKSDYPNGLPPIKLTFSSSPRNQVRFEWMQNQLKTNLGLDVQLEPVESKAYTELLKNKDTTPQMFFLGWCQDYPDPQNWLTTVFHSSSTITHVNWKNEEYDRLTMEADVEKDPARRLELYNQAHQILLEETPVMMFYYNVAPTLIKPYITGMRESVSPRDAVVPGFQNIENIDIQK